MKLFPSQLLLPLLFLAISSALDTNNNGPVNIPFSQSPESSPPESYFRISTYSSRLDGRFTNSQNILTKPQLRRVALRTLTRSFLLTMQDLKVTPFLAHSSLLGHHWGGRNQPWDNDVGVHVLYRDLKYLAAYYNMTIHKDWSRDGKLFPGVEEDESEDDESERKCKKKKGRTQYLLEINPQYTERHGQRDHNNVIDARWIDTSNGLFLDVTALVEVQDPESGEAEQIYLVAKDGNAYKKGDVLPLRLSTFEDVPAYVPNNAKALLEEEHGKEALVKTISRGYEFNGTTSRWEAISSASPWTEAFNITAQ